MHRFSGLAYQSCISGFILYQFLQRRRLAGIVVNATIIHHQRKRRLAIDAKIQRTHKSIFQTNDGFSRCFGDGDWFRRAGTMSPHGDSINFLRNRAQQRKFLARLRQKFLQMRNTPDARRVNANHAFSASSCAIRARTFSRHAGVSTPGPVAATSNVRMLIPALINRSCSSDSACSGMDSGNWL